MHPRREVSGASIGRRIAVFVIVLVLSFAVTAFSAASADAANRVSVKQTTKQKSFGSKKQVAVQSISGVCKTTVAKR